MEMFDLHTIKRALLGRLANETQFFFLNTRIILRTGLDLSQVAAPSPNADGARKVLHVLKEMGYDLTEEAR